MDEDRIERIAKAMCRAARKDPYAPLQQQLLGKTTPSANSASYKPTLAWVEYRDEAARFVATNADAAQRL